MSHRFAHSIVILAIATINLAGQSAQEVYERFRAWFSQQPVEVQRSSDSDLETRYRAHLKQQGLAPGAVEVEIRTVNEQGKRLEVERWNRILTAEQPRFNINPNGFMVEMVKGRKPGKALDVGMGQGRNALAGAAGLGCHRFRSGGASSRPRPGKCGQAGCETHDTDKGL